MFCSFHSGKISQGVTCCFDNPLQQKSPEEAFFERNRGALLDERVRLTDFLAMVSKLSQSQKVVTLGQAKDRIVQLTQVLARKEY